MRDTWDTVRTAGIELAHAVEVDRGSIVFKLVDNLDGEEITPVGSDYGVVRSSA